MVKNKRVISTKSTFNEGSVNVEQLKEKLRERRQNECFPVVNRGTLWYNKLSVSQYAELKVWYEKWLNVTETMAVPVKPSWLDKKLEEEIIL